MNAEEYSRIHYKTDKVEIHSVRLKSAIRFANKYAEHRNEECMEFINDFMDTLNQGTNIWADGDIHDELREDYNKLRGL